MASAAAHELPGVDQRALAAEIRAALAPAPLAPPEAQHTSWMVTAGMPPWMTTAAPEWPRRAAHLLWAYVANEAGADDLLSAGALGEALAHERHVTDAADHVA